MTRKDILAAIDHAVKQMEILSAEVSHVMKLIARYPGYDKFRGNSRLDYLHEMHEVWSEEVESLRKELDTLPYNVWLTVNGKATCVAKGFDSIKSAEEWINRMDRGQGTFAIYRVA